MRPYELACFPRAHSDEREPIRAPLRSVVADHIARRLDAEGRPYVRSGNNFLLPPPPRYQPAPFFPPPGDTQENFSNEVWKYAAGFAEGFGFQPRSLPLPPAVERVIARWEARNGTFPRTPDRYVPYEWAERLPACDLVRAVLTVADDTPEERAADALLSETRAAPR